MIVSEMVPSLTPATPPMMLLAPELATSVFCAEEFAIVLPSNSTPTSPPTMLS